jgi:hypothetical protein
VLCLAVAAVQGAAAHALRADLVAGYDGLFVLAVAAVVDDDSQRARIVDLRQPHVLALHLLVYAVQALQPPLQLTRRYILASAISKGHGTTSLDHFSGI